MKDEMPDLVGTFNLPKAVLSTYEDFYALAIRQYKNDGIAKRNLFVLKLPHFLTHCIGEWKSAAISKETNYFGQLCPSYIFLALEAHSH